MVYFWAMGVVAVTALLMGVWRPVLFLAVVSLLSFYLPFGIPGAEAEGSGAGRKRKAGGLDGSGRGILCVRDDGAGGWLRPAVLHGPLVVPIVLGLMGMRASGSDLWMFIGSPRKKNVLVVLAPDKIHGELYRGVDGFFDGDGIAYVTHAGIILWLWPITVGLPAIMLTTMYFTRKFAPREKKVVQVS